MPLGRRSTTQHRQSLRSGTVYPKRFTCSSLPFQRGDVLSEVSRIALATTAKQCSFQFESTNGLEALPFTVQAFPQMGSKLPLRPTFKV